ncbi:hypothetical protein QUF74_16145 [Candidatus Halobeggiatoa sp. HSG11]|nr:hypothetical protein [Candidatus Halobeggiatoa sp. HSG11]
MIRSTIPNADMYFLNPNGIMFGPNTKLDVQGSFHASTADYLRLGENGRFDARYPSDSLLTVAPVEAFGFLDGDIADISVGGHGEFLSTVSTVIEGTTYEEIQDKLKEQYQGKYGLSVPEGKTLSLIGGNLTIKNYPFLNITKRYLNEDGSFDREYESLHVRLSTMYAPNGRINLASVASKGEVKLGDDFVDVSSFTRMADINIKEESQIETSGEGGGAIFIRSGQFVVNNSEIKADTKGQQNGYGVDIEANNINVERGGSISSDTRGEGNAGHVLIMAKNNINVERGNIRSDTFGKGNTGKISIEANDISLTKSNIVSSTKGEGNAEEITINADDIFLNEESRIFSSSGGINSGKIMINADNISLNKLSGIASIAFGRGNSGEIVINADDISLNKGGRISSSSGGNAGNVYIYATGIISVIGVNTQGWGSSAIASNSNSKRKGIIGGKGGNILIKAKELIVKDGGQISVSSIAFEGMQSNQSGNINIHVSDLITLSGVNPYGENRDGFGAGIYARSIGEKAGDGGSIELSAGSLIIEDGAVIETSTYSTAYAGDINIKVNGTVQISGESPEIKSSGLSDIHKQYLEDFSPHIYNQSTSGIYSNSYDSSEQSGQGGDIELAAQNLVMTNKGTISTSSSGGGKAGTIALIVDQLQLDNTAKITSENKLTNTFDKKPEQFLNTGDILEVTDDGKIEIRFILDDKSILFAPPINTVANLAELEKLKEQYNNLTGGQVVEVEDIGHGQSARFIYGKAIFYDYDSRKTVEINDWFQIKKRNSATLIDYEELDKINFRHYSELEPLPYPAGTVIKVNDYTESYDDFLNRKGKPATFIYTVSINFNSLTNRTIMEKTTTRVIDHTVANETELEHLSDQIYLGEKDRATVLDAGNGEPAKFVYYNDKWIKLGITHKTANTDELEQPQYPQVGNIAKDGNNRFIFSGQEWLPTTNFEQQSVQHGEIVAVENQGEHEYFTYTKNGWKQRDIGEDVGKITITTNIGEIVAVENQEQLQHFFYTKDGWKQQTMGGNAGTITITTYKGIHLFNDSQITTQAINSGGGGITIKGDGLLHIVNSKVSSSVKAGAGDGGNLTLDPKFIVLENGEILAQANKGGGGNININTDSIYRFGDETANPIDASSKLGIDGEIDITSLDVNVADSMLALPVEFVSHADKIESCSSRDTENLSTLKIIPTRGNSNSPEDLLPSPPHFFTPKPLTTTNKGSVPKFAAYDTGCKLKQSINK